MKFWAALFIAVLLVVTAGEAPAVRAACDDPYTVQRGDSLVSIAAACGVDNYIVLMDINPDLSDPNLLRPGQMIRLTAETPLPFVGAVGQPKNDGMQAQSGGDYIVRSGDALGRIAMMYNTTVAELYRVNPRLGGRPIIFPGQHIQIPPDATLTKGWVGVSAITAQVGDEIEARIDDFPPYQNVDFVLRLNWEKVYGPEGADLYDGTTDSVIVDGFTDARGQARAVLTVPYYAGVFIGQPWLVEVYTSETPRRTTAKSANIFMCDQVYNFNLGKYVLSCVPQ